MRVTGNARLDRLSPRHELVACLLITLVAFAIRAHKLGGDSFWVDEVFTIQTVHGGAEALLSDEDHPPLVYVLTALSMNTFGENEFTARVPALWASVLAIPLLLALGMRLKRSRTGLWAALLLTFSPLHLKYAQEARHYTLLTTLTLASFILLHRALQRPSWRSWLAFAAVTVTNLYTHYAAFVVLLSQGALAAIWLVRRGRFNKSEWRFPAVAAVAVVAAYLPWIRQAGMVVKRNIGPDFSHGMRDAATLSEWLREMFYGFGMYSGWLPYLLLALSAVGLLRWLWRKEWDKLLLWLAAIVLPLLLVVSFQLARGIYIRYVLFALPFYLFSAGAGINNLLHPLQRYSPWTYKAGNSAALAALILLGLPVLQQEYNGMYTDWRGVMTYLEDNAQDGDVLLLMATNYGSGFNTVSTAFPYYVEQSERSYQLLHSNRLRSDELAALSESDATVWAILYNWISPTSFNHSGLKAQPFQQWLTVLHTEQTAMSTLKQLTSLYETVIPLAGTPSPQCLLRRDVAAVYVGAKDGPKAQDALAAAQAQCSQVPSAEFETLWQQTANKLEQQLLAEAIAAERMQQARTHAAEILRFDPKHQLALEVMTSTNLLTSFEAGKVTVAAEEAPEPVSIRRFTMPQNGDWEDVLFAHPPATLSFAVELPAEPVVFHTRLSMAPESWSWGGDGATFVLGITDSQGEYEELMRQHITKEQNDLRWHDVTVSLSDYVGEQVTLTLVTESGPAGDGTGDWAGWGSPRLIWMPDNEAEGTSR